jgi:Leucine-rich repeat (LRR) protein
MLDLSDNSIQNLGSLFDGELQNLQSIDLSKNKIRSVTRDALAMIPLIQYLNLEGNGIAVISPDNFAKTRFEFDLSTHINVVIDTDMFQHPFLIELRLNTRLDSSLNYNISKWTSPNNRLKYLYADGSNLGLTDEQEFLDIFGNLVMLDTLSLAHSQLDHVSANMFSRFPLLSTLTLRDNAISVLPEGVFALLSGSLWQQDYSGQGTNLRPCPTAAAKNPKPRPKPVRVFM